MPQWQPCEPSEKEKELRERSNVFLRCCRVTVNSFRPVWILYPVFARRRLVNRHKRPIGAHFHSGGVEFSYLGQDFDEAFGEPEEPIASAAVC